MKKNYWSKIPWLILGLVPLLLIACGGGAVAPSTPATDEPAPPPTAESVAPTDEPAAPADETVVEEPTVEVMDVVEEVEAEMADEIMPVSAKPQLIEFYADW